MIAIASVMLAACSGATISPSAGLPPTVRATATGDQPSPTGVTSPVQTEIPLPSETPSALPSSPTVTLTPTVSQTPTTSPTPTPDLRPMPNTWSSWPTLPTASARVLEIYRQGQLLGNDPHHFSRIGDCQSVPAVFMGIFDEPGRYWLGNYADIQPTIDQFAGSFGRESVTAKDGFGVSSVFSPLMADPSLCESNETPIACEFRIHKPIIVFVGMGTNWAPNASASFEKYLREIVEYAIEQGVIPVLMTKADNIEGDYLLNESIAQVAYDYDIPLVNVWLAVQYLPNHGLEDDGVYLTTAGWDERAFAALRALDRVWHAVNGDGTPTPSP